MTKKETIKANAGYLKDKSAVYVSKFLKEVTDGERAELCRELTEMLKATGAMAR